jgi:cytoskeletal protein CcmA (bactofilin family)
MNDVDQKPTTPARSLEEVPPAPTTTAPRRSTEPSSANRSVGARMTVGPGIKLKGEVSDCDTLVVEGTVEATLKSEVLEVADGGTYTGTATVTDAEIHGRFEGELTVTGVLQIRSTGHVTGTIKYGRIEVESGGEIAGTVTREESGAPTATSPENRPLTAPRQVSQNASQAS